MAGLSIAPATGQQTSTQNPQTVPTQTVGGSTKSSGVQPGTATSLLTSQQGVSLGGADVTTVSLVDTGTQTQTQATAQPASQPAHHISAAWLVIPIVLCLAAAGMFWAMSRSAKSTTY